MAIRKFEITCVVHVFLLGSAVLEDVIRIQIPIRGDLDNGNIQEVW